MLGREQSEDKVLPNFLYLITTLNTHLSKAVFSLSIFRYWLYIGNSSHQSLTRKKFQKRGSCNAPLISFYLITPPQPPLQSCFTLIIDFSSYQPETEDEEES